MPFPYLSRTCASLRSVLPKNGIRLFGLSYMSCIPCPASWLCHVDVVDGIQESIEIGRRDEGHLADGDSRPRGGFE